MENGAIVFLRVKVCLIHVIATSREVRKKINLHGLHLAFPSYRANRSRGRIFRSPGDQQFGYGIPHILKITWNIIFILVCCCFSKVADCGPLRKPDHGDIIEQVAFTYGNRIVFECTDTGYEMKGSRVRTCQSDGTWSGSPTTCESTLEKINQPKKSHIDHVEYFNNGICFATEL